MMFSSDTLILWLIIAMLLLPISGFIIIMIMIRIDNHKLKNKLRKEQGFNENPTNNN